MKFPQSVSCCTDQQQSQCSCLASKNHELQLSSTQV